MNDFEKNIEYKKLKPIYFFTNTELEKKVRGISDADLVDVPEKYRRNFWKHTPFGRTLSLRNDSWKKVLKIVGGIAGAVLTAYTGIELDIIPKQTIEPMFLLFSNTQLLELINDPIAIIVTIALLLFTVFSGWLIHKGFITDRISTEIKEVLSKVKDARDPDSPGGAEFTQEERAIILSEGIDVIESVLEKYGIDIDLDGDGK